MKRLIYCKWLRVEIWHLNEYRPLFAIRGYPKEVSLSVLWLEFCVTWYYQKDEKGVVL